MRAADLAGKKLVIWGLGREGKAVASFIRAQLPRPSLVFADEAEGPNELDGFPVARGAEQIKNALDAADILIKSPGVSLYHPLIEAFKKKGGIVTSLLNLWLAEPRRAFVIGVTGTKGKSTTSALLAHTLNALGKKTGLGGNIGVPLTEVPRDADYAVIEISSYQAASLTHNIDMAILTLLAPEHLDWHGGPERYYADKLNLFAHAQTKIANAATAEILCKHKITDVVFYNGADGFHIRDGKIYDGEKVLGAPDNAYLARPHNLVNVCAVLTAIQKLGLDTAAALRAMADFRGLPHRQQELGEKDGVLYVDDSIATTPQAALAALAVYAGRPVTLIAGGFDRGQDYAPLTEHILQNNIHAVIGLGASGARIIKTLREKLSENLFEATTMQDAVARARKLTPKGGVILLSPAAPSFGLFRDFVERGKTFAKEGGF